MVTDNKASYYDAGEIETINVLRAKLTKEQFRGWLLGNLIKYSCRANWKGCFWEDIRKIHIYSRILKEMGVDVQEIDLHEAPTRREVSARTLRKEQIREVYSGRKIPETVEGDKRSKSTRFPGGARQCPHLTNISITCGEECPDSEECNYVKGF